METKKEVLKILIESSPSYISGEKIAEKLGKSRAAVWKAVKALEKDGFGIDAVTNKGYRLNEENDILSADAISAQLNFKCRVIYYSSTDSTNTRAKHIASDNPGETLLIVANEQTHGRGRQGKSFYSPALTGIYMSYVTHPMAPLKNAVTATTAAAVAVCCAIEKMTDKKPKIKWVNDVYLEGRKICGILTEAVTDFESGIVTSVIIGIGMNIKTVHFPPEVDNASNLGADIRRADLIAAIANELDEINSSPYSDFIDYYRAHSLIIGKKIEFIENSKVYSAVAVGINEKGGLTVRLDSGEEKTLFSGEISIRADKTKQQ